MCIFIVADLTKNVLKLVERTDMQSLTFLYPQRMLRAISCVIGWTVESMELSQYPELEFFPTGESEAYSILLDPSRILQNLGLLHFSFEQIILGGWTFLISFE